MKLEIDHVTKVFGTVRALDDFCADFEPGIYAILGPNGAGKSTLINLITDNVKRDKNSGQIRYEGIDILQMGKRFWRLVGYMPQQQGFYDQFSARAFLKYMAEMKEIPSKEAGRQIEELLKVVNLYEVQHRKVGGFSGGMKQRVLLAQALLGAPKILILDEPTAGLDPKERIRIRNFIADIAKDKIILFATHVVSDIECIANEVLLMNKGQLIQRGTPLELIESLDGKVGEVDCGYQDIPGYQKHFITGNLSQKREGMTLRLVKRSGEDDTPFPHRVRNIRSGINLEDVYMYYLGQ